ncbi:MAG TPA: DUF3108 domain-containing protein [Caulobacterales bacterium]|nr:DUF3108 domain-containing protein [Caulobacterales bacterium]
MLRALLVIGFLFAFAAPAAADRYALSYEGFALGIINVGHASIDADVSADSYSIAATMESGGLLSWFERTHIEASASGEIADGAVRWRRYTLDHHYSRKHRVIDMQVGVDGAVAADINPTYRIWGDPRASDEQIRASRDPLSTLMAMAVDVGRSRRCEGAYPTFDGRFHYLLALSGGDIDHYSGGGYRGDVLKCALSYIAVAGFEARDRGRRRVPRGQVWFALAPDSRFAPPIHMAMPLSAGGATVRLTSWRRAIVSVADTN